MLFHITQTHPPELCPLGEGGSSTLYNPKAEGVKFLAMYGAFPGADCKIRMALAAFLYREPLAENGDRPTGGVGRRRCAWMGASGALHKCQRSCSWSGFAGCAHGHYSDSVNGNRSIY